MNAIKLHQLIVDAAENVPFYRQHWRAAGVDLTRVASAVQIGFLPVVRKSDLRACPQELRLDERALAEPQKGAPSPASFGTILEAQVYRRSLKRQRARFGRALKDSGYVTGERLMLICEPPFALGSGLMRWTYADARDSEAQIFATYTRTRPHVLYGSLSWLLRIAQRVLAAPDAVWRPKMIVSTGAQLTDVHRTLLQTAFNAGVADFYCLGDLGLVAFSPPGRTSYQVFSDEFHLEFTPSTERPGLERLVLTDLEGGPMPLIRFDTGDLVRRDATRPGAPIVQIVGRQVPLPEASEWQMPVPAQTDVAAGTAADARVVTESHVEAPLEGAAARVSLHHSRASSVLRRLGRSVFGLFGHSEAPSPAQAGDVRFMTRS